MSTAWLSVVGTLLCTLLVASEVVPQDNFNLQAYDEYALIYNLKMKGGVPTVLNKLYGRASQLNPQMLERFRQFSLESGILPENIAILPQNGECPDA
ncbi:hypothetical protein CRUP_015660 [Coryphaenoides rupestris]|nr:hypothetical protein CRUP_015660 [Coryphaenoides rupestris]